MFRQLYLSVLLACLLTPSLAFPSYGGHDNKGVKVKFPEPQQYTGPMKIPDRHHPYKAPGPNDKRGPCPALNTLANHGYLPRNGIASAGEIVQASGEAFNLGYNFSVAVSSLAVLSCGNILLDKVSIGGEHRLVPALPGKIDGTPGGLSKHGRFEGDVSMTRLDAVHGDPAVFQPEMYKDLLKFVDQYGDGDIVTPEVFAEYRFKIYNDRLNDNPVLTWHQGRLGFSYGEAGFILNLFRNSETGNLTRQDMTQFFVEERFPENWYRKETPFEFDDIRMAVDALEESHPVRPGKKDVNGMYVVDTPETSPFLGTVCGTYYDLLVPNIAGVLLETKGQLKKNVDTYLDGMFQLFEPYGCPRLYPEGPAEL
ncbi:Chloroperoxidase [Pterulicium gracile]|uniref:Chloroperoxidase n=1 Tax=Pterulicium gracile TaxID=1884261 RepID=A0A5C3Q5W3_9AGAR|nr:Chloroperoxidase [Pterula gracilis]